LERQPPQSHSPEPLPLNPLTDGSGSEDVDLTPGMDTVGLEKAKAASRAPLKRPSTSASEAASDPRQNQVFIYQRGKTVTPGYRVLLPLGQAHLADDASPALGTYFFIAHEQATLEPQLPDTRWDVYGLGALLYAMLIGRPPRDDPDSRRQIKDTASLSHRLRRYREVLAKVPPLRKHRTLKGMDGDLSAIIDCCLEIDPEKRFHDADALLAALKPRDRRRRERPLILFALAAPMVLLALIAAVALLGVRSGLDFTQRTLSESVQGNDLFTARLVAKVINEVLSESVLAVQKHANDPRLTALMSQPSGPEKDAALTLLLEEFQDLEKVTIAFAVGISPTIRAESSPSIRASPWPTSRGDGESGSTACGRG
jgi:serine/threonine protein kinase